MCRFLLLDIGAGTLDILYYNTADHSAYKAVVQSPVRTIARKIAQSTGNLLVTGCEMGGGPVTQAIYQRAGEAEVLITAPAASTLNHDPDEIRRRGVTIISESEADALGHRTDFTPITLADVDQNRIKQIVDGFGVPFAFDTVAVCAQDHGMPPPEMSHLAFRHLMFRDQLEKQPYPHTMLYDASQVPPAMNRLSSIARSAAGLPTDRLFVMDSGMAAILGATQDRACKSFERKVVMDIATSHTVCAALEGDILAGFFEYHTRDITPDRLAALTAELTNGTLTHEQILAEGGHGAYIRSAFGFQQTQIFLVTGPRRRLIETAGLPLSFGAPWGDNMMTGTVGLLEGVRRRLELDPLSGSTS